MPPEIEAGQDAPVVIDQATNTEAAQSNAATTDAATGAAEGGTEAQAAPPKTFTQSELDDIVRREKSKAEAKAERRVLRTIERVMPQGQSQQSAPQQGNQEPRREQFQSDAAYLRAMVTHEIGLRDQHTEQQRYQERAQRLTHTTESIYAKAQAQPGFDREAFDELPLTRPIVEALIESDQSAQLMVYMAANPEDIARIAGMSPARQAAELGKLEVKLASKPPVKTSKAPDPITNPIGSGKTPVVDLQTADMDSYIAMRKKQGAQWAK